MKNQHENLIASLSEDLQPSRLLASDRVAIIWLVVSLFATSILMHWIQPFRPNVGEQLISVPRFLIEILLGLAACTMLALCALRSSVPAALSRRFLTLTILVTIAWLSQYLINFHDPILAPSMHGKRPHCYLEALIYSIPAVSIGTYLIWKRAPLHSFKTALLTGLAASMLPALIMQLSCMHDPHHVLTHHVGPGILSGFIFSLVITALLHWQKQRSK